MTFLVLEPNRKSQIDGNISSKSLLKLTPQGDFVSSNKERK